MPRTEFQAALGGDDDQSAYGRRMRISAKNADDMTR
jgi:hypothetical protein